MAKRKRHRFREIKEKGVRSTPWLLRLEDFINRFSWLFLAIIVLIALGLRASDLRADPPPDLSWSFAPYTDESLNTYSARNLVLYRTWRVDDFFPFVVYPLVNILVALVYRLFGIGFVQVKLISVFAGVIGVVVFYLLLKEMSGKIAGLIGGLLLATCYPLVMYSRLGLVETVQTLFLLLTGLFWLKGLRRNWLLAFAGFFAVGTVLLVKISALFIVPVIVLMFILEFFSICKTLPGRRALFSALFWFFLGALTAFFFWFFVVFLPYRNEYIQYVLRHSTESPAGHPTTISAYLFNTFTLGVRARLLSRLAVVALIGFIALPWLRRAARYIFLWFIFGFFMLGYMNYRPPRYEIVLIPPLIASFGIVMGRFLKPTGITISKPRPDFIKTIGYSCYLWPLITQLILYFTHFHIYYRSGGEVGVLLIALLGALFVGFVGYILLRKRSKELKISSPFLQTFIVLFLVVLSLRSDLSQFLGWFSSRTYNMISYCRDLDSVVSENAVVAGPWAPPLMLESKKRAVAVTDWANIDNLIDRFGVTHLILGEGETDRLLVEKLGPKLINEMTLLREYQVRGQLLRVYLLPPLSQPN